MFGLPEGRLAGPPADDAPCAESSRGANADASAAPLIRVNTCRRVSRSARSFMACSVSVENTLWSAAVARDLRREGAAAERRCLRRNSRPVPGALLRLLARVSNSGPPRRTASGGRGSGVTSRHGSLHVPRDGQAHRAHLQPRLQVLLLPGKGGALSAGVPMGDAGRGARVLHPPVHRGPGRAGGAVHLAGRRTDAAGCRLLPEGRRPGGQVRQRQAGPERLPDQRRRCSTTSGDGSSRKRTFSSACPSTDRGNCTTPTAWTRAASPRSTA